MPRLLVVVVTLVVTGAGLVVTTTTAPSFTPQAEDCYFAEAEVPVVSPEIAPDARFCPPRTNVGVGRW